MIDANPGGYKIGESVVPEQFRHPELRALLPKIRALPSCSPKHGTTFVSHDSVAAFPLPQPETELSMHVARHELEALIRQEWEVPVCQERVVRFDLDAREVVTDGGTYRFRNQVLDCSGPAMLLGRALGLRDEMWSVHAAWRYMDILAIDDSAFWSAIE